MKNPYKNIYQLLRTEMPEQDKLDFLKVLKYWIDSVSQFESNNKLINVLKENNSNLKEYMVDIIDKFNIKDQDLLNVMSKIRKLPRSYFASNTFSYHSNSNETATHSLEKLVINILGKHGKILDYCSGDRSFLRHIGLQYTQSQLYGIEKIDNDYY